MFGCGKWTCCCSDPSVCSAGCVRDPGGVRSSRTKGKKQLHQTAQQNTSCSRSHRRSHRRLLFQGPPGLQGERGRAGPTGHVVRPQNQHKANTSKQNTQKSEMKLCFLSRFRENVESLVMWAKPVQW